MRRTIETTCVSAKSVDAGVAGKRTDAVVGGADSLAQCLEVTMAMDIIGVVTHTIRSCITLIAVVLGECFNPTFELTCFDEVVLAFYAGITAITTASGAS